MAIVYFTDIGYYDEESSTPNTLILFDKNYKYNEIDTYICRRGIEWTFDIPYNSFFRMDGVQI